MNSYNSQTITRYIDTLIIYLVVTYFPLYSLELQLKICTHGISFPKCPTLREVDDLWLATPTRDLTNPKIHTLPSFGGLALSHSPASISLHRPRSSLAPEASHDLSVLWDLGQNALAAAKIR